MERLEIKNFINGKWGGPEENNDPLYNPSTGEKIGSVPISCLKTADEATTAAARAYETWSLMPIAKRIAYLYKIHACMTRDLEKLAWGIAYDQAKQIGEARGEVQRVIEIVESTCSATVTMQGECLDLISGNINVKVVRQSLGVFAGVAPFNFPALVFGWFIPYAIVAGNTFVFKPSTQSPYFKIGRAHV